MYVCMHECLGLRCAADGHLRVLVYEGHVRNAVDAEEGHQVGWNRVTY